MYVCGCYDEWQCMMFIFFLFKLFLPGLSALDMFVHVIW